MGKYSPLRNFLVEQGRDQVPMTFADIEQVLGIELPASKQYPAWWSNNPSNNPMTKEWLAAGFETESVDTASGRLVFRRVKQPAAADSAPTSGTPTPAGFSEPRQPAFRSAGGRAPMFGCMKGLGKVQEGYDLTQPSDADWADLLDA